MLLFLVYALRLQCRSCHACSVAAVPAENTGRQTGTAVLSNHEGILSVEQQRKLVCSSASCHASDMHASAKSKHCLLYTSVVVVCRTWSNTFAAGLRSVVASGTYEARR